MHHAQTSRWPTHRRLAPNCGHKHWVRPCAYLMWICQPVVRSSGQESCLRLEGIISPRSMQGLACFSNLSTFWCSKALFWTAHDFVWLLVVQIDPFELSILSLDTPWLSPDYDGDPLHLYNANSVPNLYNKILGLLTFVAWIAWCTQYMKNHVCEWFLYGYHYTNRDVLPRSQIGSHFINRLSLQCG